MGGMITETEAYTEDDAASHAYKGKSNRNRVMFGESGHIYVYFTYGMHYCMNIVTGHEGRGEGVLIRSIKPDKGLDIIKQRRNNPSDNELMNGPAKICQALGITTKDNGAAIDERIILLSPISKIKTKRTRRIGITKDVHRLWRFISC